MSSQTFVTENSQRQKRPFLIAGGAGCALLLCVGLLAVGAVLMFNRPAGSAAQSESNAPDIQSRLIATSVPPTPNKSAADTLSITTGQTGSAGPKMGAITFAPGTTADGEPVAPDFTFEAGLTRLHAVFEYSGIATNALWTQVWYHNGLEVLSNSQPWLQNESGLYNYVIEAGGDPLPPGQWTLEFYINDQLLAAGSFLIEADAQAAASESPDLDQLPKLYKLAYTKWNGEKHDLYVGDTNGSREQFVMSRAAGPSWSPDGRYIFFYGEEGVDQQVVNGTVYPLPGVSNGIARLTAIPLPANVGQLQLLQGHGWNDGTARWANVSPDGSMIAYDGDRGGGRRVYFLGTNANQQFRYEIIGEQADWSPDSQKIVYRSGRNNQFGIWISNRDDSGHVRLTEGGSDSFPTWSPNGQTIAFSREAGGNVDIYAVNVDGANLRRLTDAPGHDTLPTFLPNGDIVFRSARGGSWAIWKMRGDGSNQTLIIPNAPVGPDWAFSKMGVLR